MKIIHFLMLIAALATPAMLIDVFKGTEALGEIWKNEQQRIELIILSIMSFAVIRRIIYIYTGG